MNKVCIFAYKILTMKTNLLFLFLIFPAFVFAQSGMDINYSKLVKKSDFLKSTNAVIQTLDSTVAFDYTGGIWVHDWKKTINGRHWSGLPYEWKNYNYNSTTMTWDIRGVERITYYSDEESDMEKYWSKPYNSFINDWDPDTLTFYNYTGYISKQFQAPIMKGDYIQKSYDYVTNSYTNGIKYVIKNLNDTLYDYYVGYSYNAAQNNWEPTMKFEFVYDQNHYMQKQKMLAWNNSTQQFENNNQGYYIFTNGQITQTISQSWTGAAWQNSDKDEYAYDANGKRTLERDYDWNSVTQAWDQKSQIIYIYSNNLVVERIDQTWNSGTSSWDNVSRYVYSYDVNGNQITQRRDDWVSGAWRYNNRHSYTYNSSNKCTQDLYEIWNSVTSVWENDAKYTYTYNTAASETSYLCQYWNSGTSLWENQYQYTTNYDANNNKIYYDYSHWDNIGGIWIYHWKENYYWSTFDANSISDMENDLLNVFPNPSNGLIEVDSKNLECESLRILDAGGNLVSVINTADGAKHVVNLRQNGAGLYYFEFVGRNGESHTKKVVVN